MSICRARLRSTSSGLTFRMSGEQTRLQLPPKLFEVNSWIAQMIRQWNPDCWSGDRKRTGPRSVVSSSDNWQLMTSGRSPMLATRNFRDWNTVVGEVSRSSVAKTTMDCHSELVLRNNQPVQVIMHQPRQTTLVFPGPCDQMCCSILNMLQLVNCLLRRGRQNRVTIVDKPASYLLCKVKITCFSSRSLFLADCSTSWRTSNWLFCNGGILLSVRLVSSDCTNQ